MGPNGTGGGVQQELRLYSATDTILVVPGKPAPQDHGPVVALDLFGSFLVNSNDEARGVSNVLVGWDQIPKYSADHLNNKEGVVPNDYSVEFSINERPGKVTLFPGTYYPKLGSAPMRRYPGVREQQVEQALILLATLQAEEETINGETDYYVTFTLNGIARRLKDMGSTMSKAQIRQALEVLSSTIMTIESASKKGYREPILPAFARNLASLQGNNGDDIWRVKLHRIVVKSILMVTYRQYPIGKLRGYSPVGAALLRRIHYILPNVSEGIPYKFTVTEMKLVTAGLTHVRLSGSKDAIVKELEQMLEDRFLTRYTVEDIFPSERRRGRPTPTDYRFTLYPGPEWIKNMKAGAKRQELAEQRLKLARSQRNERHTKAISSEE